ncbi:MAG: aldehyde dehydrogenase family protein, partial [Methylocella sp.]
MVVDARNAVPEGKCFINGKWVEPRGGKTFDDINPATAQPFVKIAACDTNDVDAAVQAARNAFDSGPWSMMSAYDREKILRKLSDLMFEHADELAELETLDSGKPISESRNIEIPLSANVFSYYAGWATKVHGETIPVHGPFFNYTLREPIGVVGCIVPWNFPLTLLTWKVAPALAMGNTVVAKPSKETPLTALKLADLAQKAGLPDGVYNVVTGSGSTVGTPLVEHPGVDKIAFTGSTEVGKDIMRRAAGTVKRLSLELGGKSPNIVFADTDMESAARGATLAIFYNKGEVCSAGSRLFVEESAHDALMEKLVARTLRMTPGNPLDPKTRLGPLVSAEQLKTVTGYIEAGKTEGAKLAAGGDRPAPAGLNGYFLNPTIFDGVNESMKIAREEIFGPVLSVLTFKDLDDAARKANDTVYGLAAGIWTRDIKKAHSLARKIRAGTVWINTYNMFDPASPFGGYKAS